MHNLQESILADEYLKKKFWREFNFEDDE